MIVFWGILMLVCSFLAWILNIIANRMASLTAASAIQTIRQDLFSRSLTLSARQIDELTLSSLESRLTSDTYIIHRFLGISLRMGVRSCMLFAGGIFFCLWLSWQLSLVLLILVPVLSCTLFLILKSSRPLFHEVQDRSDRLVQVIRENVLGIKVVKAFDRSAYEKARFAEANGSLRDAEVKANDRMALLEPMVNFILFGGLCTVLITGARLAEMNLVQAGTVMAFLSYFIQIANSIMGFNRLFNLYNRSLASTERISAVLRMPLDHNQTAPDDDFVPLPASRPDIPEIEFRDVSFSYLGEKQSLSNLSFRLFAGEKLGVMGATGSGKSTIIRLLLRQYELDAGEILIRGVPLRKLDPTSYRKLFGIVLQNDFLYGDSIRENIRFGRDLSDSEIENAAEAAQAAEFIRRKEGGFDFILASKGVNLSGGQKQRLLVSRALAARPDILILDDSSSALDFRTEARLRTALGQKYPGSTSIVIAQRISSVVDAKQILFLEQGQTIALGSHPELMENCPPYREIAETQLGEFSALGEETDIAENFMEARADA